MMMCFKQKIKDKRLKTKDYMNIRSKIISIDIFFCELYKDFTTKGTKGTQKLMKKILSFIHISFQRNKRKVFMK